MAPPLPARTRVVVFIVCSLSKVVVHVSRRIGGDPAARAESVVDAHHAPLPLGSRYPPSPARMLLRVIIVLPQPPCGSMPTPSPADTPVCSVIVDALVKVKGLVRRQPMGSMQLPVPARIVVVVRMAVSVSWSAMARLPRCARRAGA
jgi:hypothetical protein